MRGKAHSGNRTAAGIGITPAYAGKSLSLHSKFIIYRGSPPPMRGKGEYYGKHHTAGGITPAYAGKRFR